MNKAVDRKKWQEILSKSEYLDIKKYWDELNIQVQYQEVKPPFYAMLMVKGKVGGFDNPFNLTEVTVTSCIIKINDTIGKVTQIGRHKEKAKLSALIDALLVNGNDSILQNLITPLHQKLINKKSEVIKKANLTKVDFFTMVRGESE